MTILKSINRSQSLLTKISSNKQLDGKTEIRDLLSSLSDELDNINFMAHQLIETTSSSQDLISTRTKPGIKSGCYIFADEKGFFCPSCYDNSGNKVATTRINSKLRVCPVCRATIK